MAKSYEASNLGLLAFFNTKTRYNNGYEEESHKKGVAEGGNF